MHTIVPGTSRATIKGEKKTERHARPDTAYGLDNEGVVRVVGGDGCVAKQHMYLEIEVSMKSNLANSSTIVVLGTV